MPKIKIKVFNLNGIASRPVLTFVLLLCFCVIPNIVMIVPWKGFCEGYHTLCSHVILFNGIKNDKN